MKTKGCIAEGYDIANINVTIGGATYKYIVGQNVGVDATSKLVNAGTFTFDPSAAVAEGYEAVENSGVWTVQEKTAPAVAKIGTTTYTDFADALAAWDAGETLTLLDNVSSTSVKVLSSGSYTLELGDYTWTANGCDAIKLNGSAGLNIKAANGGITAANSSYDCITAETSGQLVISGGTYNGDIFVSKIDKAPTILPGVKVKELVRSVHDKGVYFEGPIVYDGEYYTYVSEAPAAWEAKVNAAGVFTRTDDYMGAGPTWQSLDKYDFNGEAVVYFTEADDALKLYTDTEGDMLTPGTMKYYAGEDMTFLSGNCTITLNANVTTDVDLTIYGGHTVTVDASASGAAYTGNVVLNNDAAKFVEKYGANTEYADANVTKGSRIGADKVIAINKETANQKTFSLVDYYACQLMQEGQPGYVAISETDAAEAYNNDALYFYTRDKYSAYYLDVNTQIPEYINAKSTIEYGRKSGSNVYFSDSITGAKMYNNLKYDHQTCYTLGAAESKPVNYKTFDAAYALAKNTEKPIILLDNLAPTVALAAGDSFTVDPNGFTFTDTGVTAAAGYKVVKTANDGGTVTYSTAAVTYVAQIGSDKYETLKAAIAAVPADGTETTITMIANETFADNATMTIAAGQNIVLDLNGKTVTGKNLNVSTWAFLTNKGTLEITDNSTDKDGKITSSTAPETDGFAGHYTVLNKNVMTLTAGTIEETSEKVGGGINLKWALRNEASANQTVSLTINGGTVIGEYNAVSNYVFDNTATCNFTVNDGSIITNGRFSPVTVQIAGATKPNVNVTITDGEFTVQNIRNTNANGNAIIYCDDQGGKVTDCSNLKFDISGGKFNTYNTGTLVQFDDFSANTEKPTGYVSGGILKVAINDSEIVSGKTCVANTAAATKADYPWKIGTAVAENVRTGMKYETVQSAVTAATSGDTIKLLKDINYGSEARQGILISAPQGSTVDREITIDLNGMTYEGVFSYGAFIAQRGKLTIMDGSEEQTGIIRNNSNTNSPYYAALSATSRGTIILNSGTVEGYAYGIYQFSVDSAELGNTTIINGGEVKVAGYAIGALNYGTIEINGGKVTSTNGYALMNNGSDAADSTMIINGGTITGAGEAIYHPGPGTCTINGGTLTGGETGIEMRAGTLNVKGGTIIGNATPTNVTENGNGMTSSGAAIAVAQHTTKLPVVVNISGGTLNGFTPLYESNPEENSSEDIAKVSLNVTDGEFMCTNGGTCVVYSADCEGFLSGGHFSAAPDAAYVAEGKDVISDTAAYKALGYNYTIGVLPVVINTESIDTGDIKVPEGTSAADAEKALEKVIKEIAENSAVTTATSNIQTVVVLQDNDKGEDSQLQIELSALEIGSVTKAAETLTVTTDSITYDVQPVFVVTNTETGVVTKLRMTNTELAERLADDQSISFSLAVPASVAAKATDNKVWVAHYPTINEQTGEIAKTPDSVVLCELLGSAETGFYVNLSARQFSEYMISANEVEFDAVAKNEQTGVQYITLESALAAAKANETVSLLKDIGVGDVPAEDFVMVMSNVTLDLRGHSIKGAKLVYATGNIIDTILDIDAKGTKGVVDALAFALTPELTYTPIYDSAKGGYSFFCLTLYLELKSTGTQKDENDVEQNTTKVGYGIDRGAKTEFLCAERDKAIALIKTSYEVGYFKTSLILSWEGDNSEVTQSFTMDSGIMTSFCHPTTNKEIVVNIIGTQRIPTATAYASFAVYDANGRIMFTLDSGSIGIN